MSRFGVMLALVLSSGLSQVSSAQVVVRQSLEGGDGVFHIKEVQAIITSANDSVKVLMALPTDMRPDGYRDIDIQTDDEVLMVNKKRVKSVKTLEKIYNDLTIGEELKLGIRRDGELFIRSFKKIDPKDIPQTQQIQIRTSAGDEPPTGEGAIMTRTFRTDDGEGSNIGPLFGTGLLVGAKDDKIQVVEVMPHMSRALGKADIKVGDVIRMINGTKISSVDQLAELFDKIETGNVVKLDYQRNGVDKSVSFAKPEARGRMIIRDN